MLYFNDISFHESAQIEKFSSKGIRFLLRAQHLILIGTVFSFFLF